MTIRRGALRAGAVRRPRCIPVPDSAQAAIGHDDALNAAVFSTSHDWWRKYIVRSTTVYASNIQRRRQQQWCRAIREQPTNPNQSVRGTARPAWQSFGAIRNRRQQPDSWKHQPRAQSRLRPALGRLESQLGPRARPFLERAPLPLRERFLVHLRYRFLPEVRLALLRLLRLRLLSLRLPIRLRL